MRPDWALNLTLNAAPLAMRRVSPLIRLGATEGVRGVNRRVKKELIRNNESYSKEFSRWSKGPVSSGPTVFMRTSPKLVVVVARGV